MTAYQNTAGIPLSLAVFLATDKYDHDPETISATALLKPLRQIILSKRVPPADVRVDVADMIASRMGTAIHDGIESAWIDNYTVALKQLGIPSGVIRKVKINPSPDELQDGDIPVYLEQRSYREFMGLKISGKFDFVGDGRVEDFKSTGVYTWMNNTSDEKHSLQGSIYRWLNPKIITQDRMAIQYIFTDWSAMQARSNPKYPPRRTMERVLPLLSLEQTESFIRQKITLINTFMDAAEPSLPPCSDEDLWRSEPVWKYYKNPAATGRSTKNFDNAREANERRITDGSVGRVDEKPGEVKACHYCDAFPVCTQKDALIASGDLIIKS